MSKSWTQRRRARDPGGHVPARCRLGAVAAAVETYGRIDQAFNNAGVTGSHEQTFDMAKWERTIAINRFGVAYCMQYEIPQMIAQGGGTIVNTASIADLAGALGADDYTAAKHGVVGITGDAARRFGGQGVRLNTVCPGVIETGMIRDVETDPDKRREIFARLSPITGELGQPEDITEAVLFLSSDRARFIHGVALPVDGGFSI